MDLYFGISLVPANFTPALIFILAPGGFITIGMIMACINIKKKEMQKKKKGDIKNEYRWII